MESGFSSSFSVHARFPLAISVAAWSELDSYWMTQSDQAVSNHEVLRGMIW